MKLASAIAAGAALVLATGALAEAHEEGGEAMPSPHFEFTGTMQVTALVGGINDSYAASWTETLTIGEGENTVTVTGTCAGMDQPDGSLFDRHFTCSQEAGDGSKGATLVGCNVPEEMPNVMMCYGYFEGTAGAVEGHAALETYYYTFGSDGTGTIVGSGQWVR